MSILLLLSPIILPLESKVFATSQTVNINPTSDTHVKASYPTSNYNTVTTLISDGNPKVITLLRFDVSSISASSVTNVQLKIKPTVTRNIDKDIMLITNTWDPATVNWNTKPAFNTKVADYIADVTSGTEFTIDLDTTTIKNNWGTYVNLGIDDIVSGETLNFNSKEASTVGVKLVVTYDDNPAPAEAVLSNGSPTGTLPVTTTQANLSVNSDVNATCKYSTNSAFNYSTEGTTFNTTGGTSHSSTVSGLSYSNSYNFYVKCQTTASIVNASSYAISFNVASPAALVASFTKSTSSGVVPVTVSFDAAGSTTDSAATITNYEWNFGDSTTATGVTASKTYTLVGNYTITLTVTDSFGRTNSTTQSVSVTAPVIPILSNAAPTGTLPASTTNTNLSLNTDVNAACKYSTTSSFDYNTAGTSFSSTGGTSHSTNVTGLSYSNPYNYYVKCKSSSNGINDPALAISFGVATPANLVANFTKDSTGGAAPVSINFNATTSTTDSSATITNYAWNFGDSTTASGITTSKTYSSAGTYTITLTVTDSLGRTSSSSQSVEITPQVFVPVLSNGAPTGSLPAGTTQANLTLNTDIAATCKYSTTSTFNYTSEGTIFSSTGNTSHSTTVTGLTDGSSYSYYVKCQSTTGGINATSYAINFSVQNPAPAGACSGVDLDPSHYSIVVNGQNRTTKLSYTGSSKNNLLIINTTINLSSADHGIYMNGLDNVTIANSTINGAYGEKQGIYISDSTNVRICNTQISEFANGIVMYGENANVLIQGNEIHHTNKNGILARQNEGTPETTTNLQILNNNMHDLAQVVQPAGSTVHGMYVQVKEYLISGNTVTNVTDGHGISVRSSGLVTNNTVSNTGASSIAYYPDHSKGSSNAVYIENNTLSLSAQRLANKELVELVTFDESDFASYVVDNFYIRYNQLTPDNNIDVDQDYINLNKNIITTPNY